MTCEWGMSELGPVSFGEKSEPVFLGRDFAQRSHYSEATAAKIDHEVARIVREAHQKATDILSENREALERVARDLLEHESLEGNQVYDVIEELTGEDVRPKHKPIVLPKPASPPSDLEDSGEGALETVGAEEAATDEADQVEPSLPNREIPDEVPAEEDASPEAVAAQRETHARQESPETG